MDSQELLNGFIGLAGAGIVSALIQVIKPFVKKPTLYPLIAMALGIIINLGIGWAVGLGGRVGAVGAVLSGILVGLAASGIYSARATAKLVTRRRNKPS